MTPCAVKGVGAVGPFGWSAGSLVEALQESRQAELSELPSPSEIRGLRARKTPKPPAPSPVVRHPRLRRSSPITQYAVAASLEALGSDAESVQSGQLQVGVILCVTTGCVAYTRRFYEETLRDAATASPLIFPETVFNAPASHVAALLGAGGMSYTLLGDAGTFLGGISLAAQWMMHGLVEGCLVIGAEEADWITTSAIHLFNKQVRPSEGAGVLYLRRPSEESSLAQVEEVSAPVIFTKNVSRLEAVLQARRSLSLTKSQAVLCDGLQGADAWDKAEETAWSDWHGARISPKRLFGEALTASAAWQCIAGISALKEHDQAIVSVVGSHQQAIMATFRPLLAPMSD